MILTTQQLKIPAEKVRETRAAFDSGALNRREVSDELAGLDAILTAATMAFRAAGVL